MHTNYLLIVNRWTDLWK